MLAEKYEARMSKIETIMDRIVPSDTQKNESSSSKQQMDRLNQIKSHLEKDYFHSVFQRDLKNINKLNKSYDEKKQKLSTQTKKEIVKREIKKLNNLICQFKSEDKNFMIEQKSSSSGSEFPLDKEIVASSQNSVN